MAEGRSRPPSAEGASPGLTLKIRCACRAVRTEEAETGQAREAGPPGPHQAARPADAGPWPGAAPALETASTETGTWAVSGGPAAFRPPSSPRLNPLEQ